MIMKLTTKEIETLVAITENMDKNFSFDEPFDAERIGWDFFNWADEKDIRGAFSGKTVSGRMSSLVKKGILRKNCDTVEHRYVEVGKRRRIALKEFVITLWTFPCVNKFVEALGIKEGDSVNDALNRLKERIYANN